MGISLSAREIAICLALLHARSQNIDRAILPACSNGVVAVKAGQEQKPAARTGSLNVNAAEFQPSFLQQPAPVQAAAPAYGEHDGSVNGAAWTEAGFGGEADAAAQEWAANHWAAYMGQVWHCA